MSTVGPVAASKGLTVTFFALSVHSDGSGAIIVLL